MNLHNLSQQAFIIIGVHSKMSACTLFYVCVDASECLRGSFSSSVNCL